ncbi:hypothetical protein N7495_005255 [Penicillium taxi]|uniref:uncharacterized protein n=1 Tax=Penicillium taxi TaxID=168475 RepID=UPI0025451575|nr:uncharacterized protein N7495_005255 [Penicillium taxi]KAJ5893564.1 hypothetical protein N7495_005255 [Penicillium taxi]
MQSLWSRAAAQSTCRCGCLSTTANGVTSRSASAASKRRLRIGNSVTALYGSLFAIATLADSRAKTQRRHDWEEKIAAVKAEVKELVDEEQRILESLQISLTKPRGFGRWLQDAGLGAERGFSFSTQRMSSHQSIRSLHTERRLYNAASANAQLSEASVSDGEIDLRNVEEEDDEFEKKYREHLPKWVVKDTLRMKAIQKLALRQFSIRILLRPAITHRYNGLPMTYIHDSEAPKMNVENLLHELNSIRLRIQTLRTNKDAPYSDLLGDYPMMDSDQIHNSREALDAELIDDLEAFSSERMSMQELLLRVSVNLLNSVDPDRTTAFRSMFITFTKTRQNDLNDLLLRTLIPNRFLLSSSLIITIISVHRKMKNLKDFDQFLQMLTADGGWSANLGSIGHYIRRSFNGWEVVVPPLDSNNMVIYSELIAAALRFEQPERADAWLQAARGVGFFDNFTTLSSYFKYYSVRKDWVKGISVLKRAVTYLISSTDHPPELVDRLIVLMSHFCDSCGQSDCSQALISAAMHSGFSQKIRTYQEDLTPIVDYGFTRWTEAARRAPAENIDRLPWQKWIDFGKTFGDYLNELDVSRDNIKMHQFSSNAALHAQHAMSSVLGDISSQPNNANLIRETSQPVSLGSVVSTDKSQPPNKQNEIEALKSEVAELRKLVFEIRKTHIGASSKSDTEIEEEQLLQVEEPISINPPTPSLRPKRKGFQTISQIARSRKDFPRENPWNRSGNIS